MEKNDRGNQLRFRVSGSMSEPGNCFTSKALIAAFVELDLLWLRPCNQKSTRGAGVQSKPSCCQDAARPRAPAPQEPHSLAPFGAVGVPARVPLERPEGKEAENSGIVPIGCLSSAGMFVQGRRRKVANAVVLQ